ncbi:unnamed protein product [marine sediment metagenome]|uniref:Uncharacterized protein n=1 Tax=marine sediment metagenome TaxID=412755 RepID=X0X2G4_9ZZZZ
MWIRINDFIINLDNVTEINIQEKQVSISFCTADWNSLAFKKEEISKNIWDFLERLPTEDENRPSGPRVV